MLQMFERCLYPEMVTFEILSDDYSKVITWENAANVRTVSGRSDGHIGDSLWRLFKGTLITWGNAANVLTVSGCWGGLIRNSLQRLFQGNHVGKCRKCSNSAWTLRWSHWRFSPTIIQRNHGAQMPQMFEWRLDAEVVTFEILSDDHSKVTVLSGAEEKMDAAHVYLASIENSLSAAVLRIRIRIQTHKKLKKVTKFHFLKCLLDRPLKVLTNEKRGGLRVISFDRSPFKLISRKFSEESVQAPLCERHKTTQRTLFILFANKNWFPITLLCLAATDFSHHTLNWNIGIVHPPCYLRWR